VWCFEEDECVLFGLEDVEVELRDLVVVV